VLRIRDVYPRSDFFPFWIPDPHQKIKAFYPNMVYELLET